jgi:hypothetical protein
LDSLLTVKKRQSVGDTSFTAQHAMQFGGTCGQS